MNQNCHNRGGERDRDDAGLRQPPHPLRSLEMRLPRFAFPLLLVLGDPLFGVDPVFAAGHELAEGGDVLAEVGGSFAGELFGPAEDGGFRQAVDDPQQRQVDDDGVEGPDPGKIEQAARVADYTGFMYLGELVERGPTAQMFQRPKNELTEKYLTGSFG